MSVATITVSADGSQASAALTIAASAVGPPPAGGYFPLGADGDLLVGASTPLSALPNDQQAAAMVHRSSWEPRPGNAPANQTQPPVGYVTPGVQAYPSAVWARVTGRCPLSNPTTDELIQWAAAKWGLSDELLRAQLLQESHWWQNRKHSGDPINPDGVPVFGNGYGDYNATGSPNLAPANQYNKSLGGTLYDRQFAGRANGPESFGISQCKWWSFRPNPPGTGFGSYPWIELSTPYALDFYAAVIRAEYAGMNQWQAGAYTAYKASPGGSAGMWGAVGNWFSGGWQDASSQSYVSLVQGFLASKPWLQAGF